MVRHIRLFALAALAAGVALAVGLAPRAKAPAPREEAVLARVAPPPESEAEAAARRARERAERAPPAPVSVTQPAALTVTALPPPASVPEDDAARRRLIEQLRLDAERNAERAAALRAHLQDASLALSKARRGGDGASSKAEKPPGPSDHAVDGLVLDDGGAPVEGAVVLVYGWGDRRIAAPVFTSVEGRFTLPNEGISDGHPHRLRVEHRRFRARETGIPPRKPEDPPTPVTVTLEDGPSLTGVVYLPSGGPAAGAQVSVIGLEPGTITDADGAFSLPVLTPGAHIVVARLADARLSAIGRATIDPEGFPPDEGRILLFLGADAAIAASGIEKLDPHVGPPKVEVWLEARTPQGPPPVVAANPGPDGVVRFEGLPAARYVVALEHPSIGYLTPLPVGVTLAAGERREVWLGRGGTGALALRALRAEGATRSCFSAWGDLGGSIAVISGSGDARLEGLGADRYFVFCNDQRGGLGCGSVVIAAGEVKTLDLVIAPCGRCTGTLVDERGAPAVGARVTDDTLEGRIVREAIVDAAGNFALEMLYPGRHLVRARLDARIAERTIEVAVGQPVGPIGLVLGTTTAPPEPEPAPGPDGPGGMAK